MAKNGDSFIVSLSNAHLDWGEFRNPTNRDFIEGEGYIQIPRLYAKKFNIYNSNYSKTGLGYNEFYASSEDGLLKNVTLLAQGCKEAGDIYAKQFSVKGNLKVIGSWYQNMNATNNNSVKVTFTSPTNIILELI